MHRKQPKAETSEQSWLSPLVILAANPAPPRQHRDPSATWMSRFHGTGTRLFMPPCGPRGPRTPWQAVPSRAARGLT